MRTLTLLLLIIIFASCRSHKELRTEIAVSADSVIHSEHHRTIVTVDSLMRNIDFSFDTLKINIAKPVKYSAKPEIIHIRATKGHLSENSRIRHNHTTEDNKIDSTKYERSSLVSTEENSSATHLYDPPDATSAFIVALLIAGILTLLFIYKNH